MRWNSVLDQIIVAFVQDAIACAIAQSLVKKLTGRNPIALSASNWEASLEATSMERASCLRKYSHQLRPKAMQTSACVRMVLR